MTSREPHMQSVSKHRLINLVLWIIFFLVSVGVFVSILAAHPIYFYDSAKYLLAAKAILEKGLIAENFLLEVLPGYPIFLAYGFKWFSDPHFAIIVSQACLNFFIDLFVVLITARMTKNYTIGLIGGIVSALMLEKAFFAASIMTETHYLFFLILCLFLFVLAVEKKRISLYLFSFISLILSGWFRGTSSLLVWIPVILFIPVVYQSNLLTKEGMFGKLGLFQKSSLFRCFLFLLINLIVYLGLNTGMKNLSYDFEAKKGVFWFRALYKDKGVQKAFLKKEIEFKKVYITWLKSRIKPNVPQMEVEPAWSWPGHSPWRTIRQAGWTHWKMPVWAMMAVKKYSYEDAFAWQGKKALIYLRDYWPVHIRTSINDFYLCFKNVRIPNKLIAQRKSSLEQRLIAHKLIKQSLPPEDIINSTDKLYKKLSGTFFSSIAAIYKAMSKAYVLLIFYLLIITGGLVGVWNRGMDVKYLCLIGLIFPSICINVILAGQLPRYHLVLLPFAVLFLFQWVIGFNKLKRIILNRAKTVNQ